MLKKSLAFGFLAATLMVAPGAAFAGDSQTVTNDQFTEQNGAALDGSVNIQNSRTSNSQNQNINRSSRGRRGRYSRYGRRYRSGCKVGSTNQSASNTQTTIQNGVAENGSINAQNSDTRSNQRQNANKFCR